VFRICDLDNDGFLGDHELNEFQKRCFNAPLQQSNLMEVKNLIKKYCENGIVEGKMSEKGFLFLHTIFIQKGRHETTWTVLRKFGYSDQLELTDEYLRPDLNIEPGASTELTEEGSDFLVKLFKKSDMDVDGALSPSELANLFNVCPNIPWGDFSANVVTNDMGWLTLDGYEALWALNTHIYPDTTLEYLAHLGYNCDARGNQLTAVRVTPKRSEDLIKGESCRHVLMCHVFGADRTGKTCFVNRLIRKSEHEITAETDSHICINKIRFQQQERLLILREIPFNSETQKEMLDNGGDCDLAIVLYDSTKYDSFATAVDIQSYLEVPTVFVATKCDRAVVKQNYSYSPAQYCKMAGLPPPLQFSALPERETSQYKVYQSCALLAANPYQQSQVTAMNLPKILTTSTVIAVAGIAAFFIIRLIRTGR